MKTINNIEYSIQHEDGSIATSVTMNPVFGVNSVDQILSAKRQLRESNPGRFLLFTVKWVKKRENPRTKQYPMTPDQCIPPSIRIRHISNENTHITSSKHVIFVELTFGSGKRLIFEVINNIYYATLDDGERKSRVPLKYLTDSIKWHQ